MLLAVAHDAFLQGMHLTAAIAAVVSLAGVVFAVTMLRHLPASGAAQPDRPDHTSAAVPGSDHAPEGVPVCVAN